MPPSQQHSSKSVPSRLNGRPPACDPCRSRKLACDHQQPICGRCKRLKREDQCIFTASRTRTKPKSPKVGTGTGKELQSTALTHSLQDVDRLPLPHSASSISPSPSTSSVPTSRFQTSPSRHIRHQINLAPSYAGIRTGTASTTASVATPSSAFDSQSKSTPATQPNSHEPSTSASIDESSVGFVQPSSAPGYLGYTSHSTVFEETLCSLQATNSCIPPLEELSKAIDPRDLNEVRLPPVRAAAILVLRNLPSLPVHKITWKPLQWGDDWLIEPALKILESLQAKYGCKFAEKSEKELEAIALLFSRNSTRPMSDQLATGREWMAQLVGDNMRWESIGILFSLRDFASERPGLTHDDLQNDTNLDTKRLVQRYCLCLTIDLIRRFAGSNMLGVQFCKKRCYEESMLAGDAAASTWRFHGTSVTLLTYMGLHAIPQPDDYIPSFCSEIKRRLCAAVFHIDKTLVLFTGRPPLLSHRYCSTPLPLDIDDLDLFEGGETLATAVESLDENGWNTEGRVSYATIMRARMMIVLIRDELIEYALGANNKSSIEALLALRQREHQLYSQFPSFLCYSPDDLSNNCFDTRQIFTRILVQLDHLQNLFLAERLLMRRHGSAFSDDGDLLLTSYRLVSLTLTFWLRMDRFSNFRHDFQWLVMAYGAPGGGILCLELLHPSFSGSHPKDSTMTRSNIVQQLSLLVGFLDWVGPTAPNADICAACKAVIQHVLDHTLNATGGGTSWPPQTLDTSLLDLDFNFDMMDTFGWMKPG